MVVNQLESAITSVHPGMGANLVGDECSFRVWAPNAIAVSVCIWYDDSPGERLLLGQTLRYRQRMSQVSLTPEPSNSSYWSVDVADVVTGDDANTISEVLKCNH